MTFGTEPGNKGYGLSCLFNIIFVLVDDPVVPAIISGLGKT
jgi:hypothetical protein